MVGWLQKLFSSSQYPQSGDQTLPSDLPPLSDSDFEFLLDQLIQGIAHGWQPDRVETFMQDLGDRGSSEQWQAWLDRFSTRVLENSQVQQRRQIGSRLMYLAETFKATPKLKRLHQPFAQKGQQLVTGQSTNQTNLIWEYVGTDIDPETAKTPPSQVPSKIELKATGQGIDKQVVQAMSLEDLLQQMQDNPEFVRSLAQQLQIESEDPETIVAILTGQQPPQSSSSPTEVSDQQPDPADVQSTTETLEETAAEDLFIETPDNAEDTIEQIAAIDTVEEPVPEPSEQAEEVQDTPVSLEELSENGNDVHESAENLEQPIETPIHELDSGINFTDDPEEASDELVLEDLFLDTPNLDESMGEQFNDLDLAELQETETIELNEAIQEFSISAEDIAGDGDETPESIENFADDFLALDRELGSNAPEAITTELENSESVATEQSELEAVFEDASVSFDEGSDGDDQAVESVEAVEQQIYVSSEEPEATINHSESVDELDVPGLPEEDHAGDPPEAEHHLTAAAEGAESVEDNQDSSLSPAITQLFNQGLVKAEQGDFTGAIADWDELLKLNDQIPQVWHNRGSAFGCLGDFEAALASFDRELELLPDGLIGWKDRSYALMKLERWQEAIASWDQTISLRDDVAEAWYQRGFTLEYLEQFAEAQQNYQRALELQPDFTLAQERLANVQAQLNQSDSDNDPWIA